MARAKQTSCRCPSDRLPPRSPTCVCNPSGSDSNRSRQSSRATTSRTSRVAGLGPAEADVFAARVPLNRKFCCKHDAQLPPQRLRRDRVAGRGRRSASAPAVGQIELGDQIDDRRLAAAGVPDQRDRSAPARRRNSHRAAPAGPDRSRTSRRETPRGRRSPARRRRPGASCHSGGRSSMLNTRSAPAMAVSAWLYCTPSPVIGEKNRPAMNKKPTRSPTSQRRARLQHPQPPTTSSSADEQLVVQIQQPLKQALRLRQAEVVPRMVARPGRGTSRRWRPAARSPA